MEKIEQLQRTAKEAQEKLSAIEKAFAQEKQALDELEHTLSTELADLEAQRSKPFGSMSRRAPQPL